MIDVDILTGTQALVRPGSPNSSISEDRINLKQPICLAKALVDCMPSSYDKEALLFKVCSKELIFSQYFSSSEDLLFVIDK